MKVSFPSGPGQSFRKNALFYKTENGSKVGGTFMSLIQTAKTNGANSLDYLTQLLKHAQELQHSPQEWMPWNYKTAVATANAVVQALPAPS